MATEGEDRLAVPADGYREGRINGLILDLASPRAGERVLDVGCRGGERLVLFHKKGCHVSGIDPSPERLETARRRLGQRIDLHVGPAEDLPFSDNEFDLVTLITSLEATVDPRRAVAEAIRVCRGRLFIGVMNHLSLIGLQGKLRPLFHLPVQGKPHHLSLSSIKGLIREQLHGVRIQWGSVLFLPWEWYDRCVDLEERLPVMNNPFGAFLGVSVAVNFSYRTVQEVIAKPVALGADTGGAISEVAGRG